MAVTQRRKSTPRATKKKPAATSPATDESIAQNPATARSEDEERRLIAVEAYYLAEHRGFLPGAELEDWLKAEATVRSRNRH